jgi:hypothetical protein
MVECWSIGKPLPALHHSPIPTKKEEKMRKFLFLLFLLLIAFLLTSEVKNPDKPLKGNWDFKYKKVWEINEACGKPFAQPIIVVSEDGDCSIYDYKHLINYIFDSAGNFKKAFGKKGEGPGEVKMQFLSYWVNDKVVLIDRDRLHYFSKDGSFIKSVVNDLFRQTPSIFINDHEFISMPQVGVGKRPSEMEINYVNLKTKQRTVVKAFLSKIKFHEQYGYPVIPGITPMMIIGYDQKNKKLYYGMNHAYTINVSTLDGSIVKTFSVERERKKIPDEAVEEWLKRNRPNFPYKKLMKDVPKELNHFYRIQVERGLVYVFTGQFGTYWGSQQFDIFSLEGNYLYRSDFLPEKGFKIYNTFFMLNNILIKDGFLYVVQENEDADIVISKCKITLPVG